MSATENEPQVPEITSEPERPEWLDPKFQTPDEQARAYSEAQREMKRAQSELDRERKQFTDALAQMQEAPATPRYDPGGDPLISAYARAVEEGDYAGMLAIQVQLTQAATQQVVQSELAQFGPRIEQASQADREMALSLAEQRVAASYGDRWASEIAPKLNSRFADRPALLPPGASVEELADAMREQANIVEAERIVAQDRAREAERQAKIAAQTLDGGTARIATDTDEKKQEWDRVRKAQTGGYSRLVEGS